MLIFNLRNFPTTIGEFFYIYLSIDFLHANFKIKTYLSI